MNINAHLTFKHKYAYLDLLRVLSVFLVMYGHFIMVGGNAREIPLIINPENYGSLPILDAARWNMQSLDLVLASVVNTSSGVLGVSLFYLVTGFLMPIMMDRYSRRSFIINRFFRIFPVLLVSILLVGLIAFIAQDFTFQLKQYLASITLTYPWLGVVPVIGVLWTLVLEVIFYGIFAVIGRLTLFKLLAISCVLVLIVIIGTLNRDNYLLWLLAWHARYITIMLIGSSIYLAVKSWRKIFGILLVTFSVSVAICAFYIFIPVELEASPYGRWQNILLAVGIMLLFMWGVQKYIRTAPKPIKYVADMVFPIYLLHGAVGLTVMFWLRQYTSNPYLLVGVAVGLSLAMSWVVHTVVEKPFMNLGRKYSRPILPDSSEVQNVKSV